MGHARILPRSGLNRAGTSTGDLRSCSALLPECLQSIRDTHDTCPRLHQVGARLVRRYRESVTVFGALHQQR